MIQQLNFLFIFMLSFSASLFAMPANGNVTGIVVAMPYRPNLPLDPHWYTADYVDYIAGLLPMDRYQVTGYFVSLENIPQFLNDMEKLKAQNGEVCVLNFCDGGEWMDTRAFPYADCGKIILSTERSASPVQHPPFILNSDDKIKIQTFLSQAGFQIPSASFDIPSTAPG